MYLEILAFSVMVGGGESYLTPFGLALGLPEWLAALLSTVPLMAGSLLQLATPRGVAWLGSNRRWAVACVTVQALCYLPLAGAAFHGTVPTVLLFSIVSVYWGAGLAAGPAWNTWVEALVPRRLRARYFASRSRASQVATGLTLLASGAFLDEWTRRGLRLEAFGLLFATAFMARAVSARLMASQREGEAAEVPERGVAWTELFSRRRVARDGRLLVVMLTATFTVHLSAPFFSPYLLERVGLGYFEWVAVLAVPYLARIFILPLWGRVSERYGTTALLWIGVLGLIPLPLFWTLSDHMGYLLSVALWSGTVWSAYELATFLLFFEAIRREERTSVLTTFYLLRSLCMVLGSLAAAWILRSLGEDRHGYEHLFAFATVARLATVMALWRFAREDGEPGRAQAVA